MNGFPDWLNATLASDASEGRGVVPGWIGTLQPGTKLVGRAFVAEFCHDDNGGIDDIVNAPPPDGCVVVVSGMDTSRTSTVGDLYALELQNLGVAGLVTDGLVRDAKVIRELGFPVWCRGVTPAASTRRNPGRVGGSVVLAGVPVHDGDVIVADDDGVVVWPAADVERLLGRAEARLQSDNERLARLQAARAAKGA